MCIPGEDVNSVVIHPDREYTSSSSKIGMCITGNAHPHREWGCALLTANWDVPHRECTSSLGMGMCLTENGDVPHWEWECASPKMGMCLTGNAHPHRECISSPGMHIVYTGRIY